MTYASYVPHLDDDARRGLADLPFEVQEETLDLLEDVAHDPASLIGRSAADPDVVIDFISHSADFSYYVFVVVLVHHEAKTVEVKRIGHARRPRSVPGPA